MRTKNNFTFTMIEQVANVSKFSLYKNITFENKILHHDKRVSNPRRLQQAGRSF